MLYFCADLSFHLCKTIFNLRFHNFYKSLYLSRLPYSSLSNAVKLQILTCFFLNIQPIAKNNSNKFVSYNILYLFTTSQITVWHAGIKLYYLQTGASYRKSDFHRRRSPSPSLPVFYLVELKPHGTLTAMFILKFQLPVARKRHSKKAHQLSASS